MNYMSTREASIKWGISATRITILANEGRIPGAQRVGKSWLIPSDAAKPPKLKANQPRPAPAAAEKEPGEFSFPLYHFRPDWSREKEKQLSAQQKSLLRAEAAVLGCRFAEAYPLLRAILSAPEDVYTEIGALWNAGISCIALNKPEDFPGIYLRLRVLLSGEFPYRDDLTVALEFLNVYMVSIGTAASRDACNTNVHEQALPMMSLLCGYVQLAREATKRGSTDTTFLEITLRLLRDSGATVVVETLHIYLMGIYFFRQELPQAEKHAKAAVQMAFDSKLYFPLVTYYDYFNSVLGPVLAGYPPKLQQDFHAMVSEYEQNSTAFLATISETSVIAKFTDSDYSLACAVLTYSYNNTIAKKLGITQQTVKRKLDKLCERLGVRNKKELRAYLQENM